MERNKKLPTYKHCYTFFIVAFFVVLVFVTLQGLAMDIINAKGTYKVKETTSDYFSGYMTGFNYLKNILAAKATNKYYSYLTDWYKSLSSSSTSWAAGFVLGRMAAWINAIAMPILLIFVIVLLINAIAGKNGFSIIYNIIYFAGVVFAILIMLAWWLADPTSKTGKSFVITHAAITLTITQGALFVMAIVGVIIADAKMAKEVNTEKLA